MNKICIVGINGFAGGYLRNELQACGYDVYGIDRRSFDEKTIAVNMLDKAESDNAIAAIRPDGIFNLAGQASPSISWEQVLLTMHLNIDISVNIAEAVHRYCDHAKIIVIGSANQYCIPQGTSQAVNEAANQNSKSPYSVSKMAQEQLLRLLADYYGLNVMFTRSFNHIGPKQKKGFVVSDFASRIVKIEKGGENVLSVGNLDTWRDFSDVRDTVRAYRLLYEKGRTGEIYNIGSGKVYQIKWILEHLLKNSSAAPRMESSYNKTAKDDSIIYSDNNKIYQDTGYLPEIPIERTLIDILNWYREQEFSCL